MQMDWSRASAAQIASAFDAYLGASCAPDAARADAVAAAAAAAGLWCFLRDDGQLVGSPECLAQFSAFSGPSNVRHHLRRRDIPAELIQRARSAFMSGDEPSALANSWDAALRESLFVAFVTRSDPAAK